MVKAGQHEISTLYPSPCYLGEAPLWHNARQSCLWVDIENCRLFEYNWLTATTKTWELGNRVSFIIEHATGQILLGLQGGLALFNLDNGNIDWLKHIDTDNEQYRCNDGYCDPSGRIWLGIMHLEAKAKSGSLYCLLPNLDLHKMIDAVTIPNGIAWVPASERLFFVDSERGTVNCYMLDAKKNHLTLERAIVHIPPEDGKPDGITLDKEGMLWVALYGGFKVIKCNPSNGDILDSITLPVPNVTNCCFAGPGLDELVVTTARENMNEKDLLKYPQSGNVFVIKNVGATGIKNYRSAIKP